MAEENLIASLLRPLGIVALDAMIVLGSGLAGCFDDRELDYLIRAGASDIPGHTGRLAIIHRNGRRLLLALGRKHLYEGNAPADVRRAVREAAALGARELILTNAAGGLRPGFAAGEIMLIDDCIGSLLGRWMLPGTRAGDGIAPSDRGDGMRPGFALERYATIELLAMERGVRLQRGVYAGVTGPGYETRAEIGMLRRMGADAVGMSTIPEIDEGTRRGMRITGLSLITNTLSDTARVTLDHGDVVEQGRLAAARMRLALDACLEAIDASA